jgi:hypothetical protein
VPASAKAVLRLQCLGSACQPPAGDHTPCVCETTLMQTCSRTHQERKNYPVLCISITLGWSP